MASSFPDERGNRADIGCVTGREQDRGLLPFKVGQATFQSLVPDRAADDESARARAGAAFRRSPA